MVPGGGGNLLTAIEFEDQGAVTRLAPGASLSWTVRWFVRQLDASVPVEVGSAELLSTVRALVQSHRHRGLG